MPNQLSKDKRRITYTEWDDVYDALKAVAKKERLDMADVIRRATIAYVQTLQNVRKK